MTLKQQLAAWLKAAPARAHERYIAENHDPGKLDVRQFGRPRRTQNRPVSEIRTFRGLDRPEEQDTLQTSGMTFSLLIL